MTSSCGKRGAASHKATLQKFRRRLQKPPLVPYRRALVLDQPPIVGRIFLAGEVAILHRERGLAAVEDGLSHRLGRLPRIGRLAVHHSLAEGLAPRHRHAVMQLFEQCLRLGRDARRVLRRLRVIIWIGPDHEPDEREHLGSDETRSRIEVLHGVPSWLPWAWGCRKANARRGSQISL